MSTSYQTVPKKLAIYTRARKQRVSVIYYQGEMVPFVIRGGKIVYAHKPVPLPECAHRLITDDDGTWLEFGFLSAHVLEGDATSGWTDPGHYLTIQCQNSMDMMNWTDGAFVNAPGGAVVNNGDGTFWYWQRSVWPKYLKRALMDFDLRSTRGGKTITALTVFAAAVTLPNFPYAVESGMPQLQTDLRAAGYTDAIASYAPAGYTAEVRRHYLNNDFSTVDTLQVTHAGASVTEVRNGGTLIALPRYPYALPSQAATLQADLVAAGLSGAVVRLFAGEWRISLPNRLAAVADGYRSEIATIVPNDPFPRWQSAGTYDGLINDNTVVAAYSNLRAPGGHAIVDAHARQFARLMLDTGTRSGTNTVLGALLHWLKKDSL